jgi:hypothetical protein
MAAFGLSARAQACAREDFATVVEQAAEALRQMNGANTPLFQERLRALKDKRKWSHEQFLKEAAPFVRDERITAFDEQTATLITRIESMGEGGSGKDPDCRLLEDLRSLMHALVETTKAKWAYMFEKLEAALKSG